MRNSMNFEKEFGNAICYSGYRAGQNPGKDIFPTYEQIKEDLLILSGDWQYIRLYDSGKHAKTVLEVIRAEALDFKVMIGVCLSAEVNNPNCPWGANYSDEQLSNNKAKNKAEIKELIELATKYEDIVFSVAAGNEATVDWSDHIVPVAQIIKYVQWIKSSIKQPVTFCENYVPWQDKLVDLAEEVDFISLHTYPLWEYKSIDEALDYTKENYYSVKHKYPHKTVVITETGWATNSNGRGMPPENANEDFQKTYFENIHKWCKEEKILTFIFEAFDEDWKGSADPLEPEKHWGLYTIDRRAKSVVFAI